MKSHKIDLLPEAMNDLDEIFDYILLDNPIAAENMLEKIYSSLQKLTFFPKAGVRLNHTIIKHYAFRMIVIELYVAFYRVIDEKVYIYRILHGSRDYLQILKDLK